MASLNITSLPRHIDELRVWMRDQNLDLLAINETRLDSSIPNESVKIINYQIIRKDRNRFGGGVSIYVRDSLNYVNKSTIVCDEIEAVCLEINKPNSKPFVVISCYRPPSYNPTKFFEYIETIINGLDSGDRELYILGDLNCNMLSSKNTVPNAQFLSLCELYQLEQLIKNPTRITMQSRTLIDVILTNTSQRIVSNGVLHLGISDHSLVYAIRKISIPNKATHEIKELRNFKNFNVNNFNADLERTLWVNVNNSGDPNEMWTYWKSKFIAIVDKHAPLKRKRIRNKKSTWLNVEIKKSMMARDKLKSVAIKTNNSEDWKNYKKAKNKINNDIKATKSQYYKERLRENSSNSAAVWKTINDVMGRDIKQSNINSIKINSTSSTTSNPQEMSETFNTFFIEIGESLAEKLPDSSKSYRDYLVQAQSSFQLRLVTPIEVLGLLKNLSANKATGLDKIPCRLVKMAAPFINDSLSSMFNASIISSIFPSDWKLAKIIPIHKGNEKDELNNYRPISILSSISKVLERLIYNQVYDYLSSNNLLSECQSGFRRFHSTTTSLLEASTEWFTNMDQGKLNSVVFLDLSKAFDTVNHSILLEKLTCYGFHTDTIKWFSSYLFERKQQCLVNGQLSSPKIIKCGVPQGSILGPLLFLMYINDLPNCLKYSKPRMFADDTYITTTGNSLTQVINFVNSDLSYISEWLLANKLSLNITKTEHMFIGSDDMLNKISDAVAVHFGNNPIKRVHKSKSLGIIIDERLSWTDHIDVLSRKVSSAIGGLRQARPFVDLKTAKTIYNSLIEPLFDYCDVVWDTIGAVPSTRLQKLNNRAARVITQTGYEVRSSDIRNQLGWSTLDERRQNHKSIMMYKVLNGIAPAYLKRYFSYGADTSRYFLRGSGVNLSLPKPNTDYMKKIFKLSGAKLWNSLPVQLKLLPTLSTFKRGLASQTSVPN